MGWRAPGPRTWVLVDELMPVFEALLDSPVSSGPYVMPLPSHEHHGYDAHRYAVAVKEASNGTTHIWSPVPLPYLAEGTGGADSRRLPSSGPGAPDPHALLRRQVQAPGPGGEVRVSGPDVARLLADRDMLAARAERLQDINLEMAAELTEMERRSGGAA